MPNKLTTPNWCPGCGDFAIWTAFKNACQKQGWDSTNTMITAGIGCHGHIVNFLNITAFEGLHGRALPIASGIKIANHKLNMFVFSGDGDGLSEGAGHFIHAARRNQDICLILHDNAIYGLTTGQTSPLSPLGFKSKSTPSGNIDNPFHALTLAITAGATFAARCYSGDMDYLEELIVKANSHKGFAIIEVLQPCVTFNKTYTHYFFQNNIYRLSNDYDRFNKIIAIEKSLEWGEKKIPVGIFYEESKPCYEEHIMQLKERTLLDYGCKKRDITELYKYCS